MASRLGDVLFWLGIIIAAGWLVIACWVVSNSGLKFDMGDVLFVFTVPVISLAVGWALRYILRGIPQHGR